MEMSLISNLIQPLLDKIVTPKIKRISETDDNALLNETIKKSFDTYLTNRYQKLLIIDTLVFPSLQTEFKKLYQPLSVTAPLKNEVLTITIDGYPDNFLPKFGKVLIEDTAGMGKSTISRKLFLSVVEQQAGIPILIELRQINKENSILVEIQNQVSQIDNKIPIEFIIKLLKEGEFVFLFDGFDEISKTDKEFVIKDLQRFIEKADNNIFLVTSRRESSLASFSAFKKFNVRPLDKMDAYSLIKRYDEYSYKPIAEQLISKLEDDGDASIDAFLTNPFLVSLLYKSFEFKKDIPQKKTQFYRQVYDALFDAHDLSKPGYFKRDKHSNLHSDDFEKVLRHISYFTTKENKVEYSIDYITNIIETAKKYTPELSFKASDYLKDLQETVPLFKREGHYIKWAHKSLQDYFTAKFIWIDARSNQEGILKKIFDDPLNMRFYNVLDLFHELDPKGFEITILLWFLEEYQQYVTTHTKALSTLDEEMVIKRLEKLFGIRCAGFVFYPESKFETSEVNSIEKYDELLEKQIDHVFEKLLKPLKVNAMRINDTKSKKYKVFNFAIYHSRLQPIIEILSKKMPELVKRHLSGNDIAFVKASLVEEVLYMVDTDARNIINQPENFQTGSEAIEAEYIINYKLAKNKLNDIRKYSSRKLDDNLLSW